jgi:hypothetical protein
VFAVTYTIQSSFLNNETAARLLESLISCSLKISTPCSYKTQGL